MEIKKYGYYRLSKTNIGGSTYGSVNIGCYWTSKDTATHRVEIIRIVRSTTPPSIPEYYIKWSDEVGYTQITDATWSIEFISTNNYSPELIAFTSWVD